MSDNIDLQLNLDPSGFVQGSQQAAGAAGQMASSFSGAERSSHLLGKALSLVTPGRIFTTAAIAGAASWQQELSGMAATAAVTHQSMQRLQGGMAALARSMPVGNRGAAEIVSTLQSLGYTGKEQIKTINDLGKAYANLGAATGQNASVIGRQMTMLNRAFGAGDANTARFTKMSDSLTQVTAKIGGSSGDILAFSKNIAPMARQAGIGQTAVMGISAAFSKMGEDGFVASNAMNKMLTDLNRSARDGSSEMGTYANIVGKTRKEFEALFKSDPTKALGLLTQRLGGGPNSQRDLERVGLDGVRTSRALQALGPQGIQSAAQTAIDAYGNGATSRAAKAATDGLYDQFTKLRSASEQVTEALGRPFLGALSQIVGLASTPIKAGASVMNNRLVQDAIKYAVPAALGVVGMRALSTVGNNTSILRQATVNNRFFQGFRGGLAGSNVLNEHLAYQNMPGAHGPFLPVRGAAGMERVGQGFGEARAAYRDQQVMSQTRALVARGMHPADAYAQASAPSDRTMAQRIRGGVFGAPRALVNTARFAVGTYTAAMSDSTNQLREANPLLRRSNLGMGQGQQFENLGGLKTQIQNNLRAASMAGLSFSERMALVTNDLKNFGGTAARQGTVVGGAAKILRAELGMLTTGLEGAAMAAKATASAMLGTTAGAAMGGGTGALGGMARGAGMLKKGALGIGGAAYSMVGGNPYVATAMLLGGGLYMGHKTISADTDRRNAMLDEHSQSSITSVLDNYRESTGRATDAIQTFAQQVTSANKALASRSVQSFGDAQSVSTSDEAYARNTRSKVQHRFKGSASQVAQQVRAISPTGMNADDLQTVKLDLLRQMPADKVKQVMALMSGDEAGAGKAPGNIDFAALLRPVSGQRGNGWKSGVMHSLGYDLGSTNLTKDQASQIGLLTGAISQRSMYNENQYGRPYAEQQQGKDLNKAFADAIKTGNMDLAKAIAAQGGQDLTGNKLSGNAMKTLGQMLDVSGGNARKFSGPNGMQLTDYLAMKDKDFAASVKRDGVSFRGGGLSAYKQADAQTTLTDGISIFGQALSNRPGDMATGVNKTVQDFLQNGPGDMQKFRDAMSAVEQSGHATGMSLTDIADAAMKTVKAFGDATAEASKFAQAVYDRQSALNEQNAGFQGTAVTGANRYKLNQSLIASADQSTEGQQRFEQGMGGVAQQKEADRQRMAARLQQQFDFQKQSERANYDYNLQLSYADADFDKQRKRTLHDYHVSVSHAQRDFNKQMTRMNEDAAKSMYDPYKRIQVQAVSDLGTLMANLGEQNQAMEAQKHNLDALRAHGVNNDVIDQLGLNKTDNAQQLQRMVEDIASGMNAGDINKIIATRMKDAAVLNTDSSNKDIKRAKADFHQSLVDQNQAFNLSLKQQDTDFAESMARQRSAFDLQLERQKTDIADSQKEILGSFDTLAAAVMDATAGKAVKFQQLMHNTLDATIKDALQFEKDNPQVFNGQLPAPGSGAGAGTPGSLGRADVTGKKIGQGALVGHGGYDLGAVQKGNTVSLLNDIASLSGASVRVTSVDKGNPGDGKHAKGSYHYRSEAMDFGGDRLEMDKLANFIAGLNHLGRIKATELIHEDAVSGQRWGIKDGKAFPYSNALFNQHQNHVHFALSEKDALYVSTHFDGGNAAKAGGLARGGIVTAPVASWVGEGGSHEAVIPLNTQGVAALARAMTQYMTGPDAQRLLTGGKGDRVTYTGNTFITDHSTHVEGPITVQAQDPNAMAKALAAKARATNLTATPTRKS